MAKTIKNQFSNVYGEGTNLNIGKNKTVKELLNNIPNVELSPDEMNNELSNKLSNLSKINSLSNKIKNTNKIKNLNSSTKIESETLNTIGKINSPIKIIIICIILILFTLIGIIYYYKDMVLQYINSIFIKKDVTSDKIDSTNAKVDHTSSKIDSTNEKVDNTNAKVDHTSSKIDSTNAKLDSLEDKINKLYEKTEKPDTPEKECPAIDTLNTKLDNVSAYSKKQTVTENGYCYIGYDRGQRDCVDVYAGDICMSGEIFPTLDICINPQLRA